MIEIGAPIMEFYGPTLRYGVEGKWVEWVVRALSRRKLALQMFDEAKVRCNCNLYGFHS